MRSSKGKPVRITVITAGVKFSHGKGSMYIGGLIEAISTWNKGETEMRRCNSACLDAETVCSSGNVCSRDNFFLPLLTIILPSSRTWMCQTSRAEIKYYKCSKEDVDYETSSGRCGNGTA